MIISGIVMASRAGRQAELLETLSAIAWLDVHFTEESGRMVVTIEAADVEQSMAQLRELQELPDVRTAELSEYYIERDELEIEEARQ
jgi:nitrate reductase NapAB chaperone NapD